MEIRKNKQTKSTFLSQLVDVRLKCDEGGLHSSQSSLRLDLMAVFKVDLACLYMHLGYTHHPPSPNKSEGLTIK